MSDDATADDALAPSLAQVRAFVARHGQPHFHCGERLGEPLYTVEAARELLGLLARAGIPPIGMEIWRRDGEELDIVGIDTWYSRDDLSLPELQADAMLHLELIQPGPDDRLTVEFLDPPAVRGNRRNEACSKE